MGTAVAKTMSESQLVKAVKTLVAKGDQATDKADQYYNSAGRHLETLKADGAHKKRDMTWEEYCKEILGFSREKADQYIRISAGRTSIEKERADRATSVAKSRAKPVLRSTGNTGRAVAVIEPDEADADHDEFNAPKNARALPQEARIRGFLYRAQEAAHGARADDLAGITITKDMREAAEAAAEAWNILATKLNRGG